MSVVKTVGIVSLSSGVLGEAFLSHEVELGLTRLARMGLTVRFMDNARRGIERLRKHPEERAADLLQAFRDPELDMILCAIGGDDTYRLLPYLFDRDELKNAVCDKIFLGFSDSTINHFMLHKLGLRTFYGQSFLADICELGPAMLPYTERYFRELVETGTIREITPSDRWYDARGDFGPDQLGVALREHPGGGFELLQGDGPFAGKILGGCIDTIFDMFDGSRYADSPALCQAYGLFPPLDDWRGRILLLESSEEKIPPEKYRRALEILRDTGIFGVLSGVLAGKPMDDAYSAEYKKELREVLGPYGLPVVCNVNVGHAQPRCVIPFGVDAEVDPAGQRITFRS